MIAACTRAAISGVTPLSPLTTRETVFSPTPAAAATSFMVGRAPARWFPEGVLVMAGRIVRRRLPPPGTAVTGRRRPIDDGVSDQADIALAWAANSWAVVRVGLAGSLFHMTLCPS
ncbi:hypothetical protein GCM10023235_64660 [Kitasatospora terrestris]|uniref:Uncharacterized protein n=1 Tax=Kitasatospora terrestris TaxID=258051 RepID=A0ABP9EFH4_9ACTN